MEKIQLCELDKVFFFLQGYYFFETELDIGRISSSFKKVVDMIPILSSTIVCEKTTTGDESKNENRRKYFFEIATPSNVTFSVKTIKDEVFHYFSGSSLSHDEGFFLHSIVHGEEIKENVLKTSKQNSPNLKFTVLTTKSAKKCILCFSINHAVADLHSVTKIMELWSKVYSSGHSGYTLERKFDFSRDRMIQNTFCSSTEGITTIDPKIIRKYPSHFPRDLGKFDECGFKTTTTGEIRILTFSKERIEELKKMVVCDNTNNKQVSSFDVISSLLWKLQAVKETTSPDKIVPLHIVVNLRNRIDDDFLSEDEFYFGNAFLCPGIEISRKEILDADLKNLTRSIRELITSISKKDLQAVLYTWSKSPPVFQRINSLFVDDWRLFDQIRPRFSPSHVCKRSILMPPYRNDILDLNWAFIGDSRLVGEDEGGGGGITVRMVFEKEFLERFGNIDMTKLDSIDFIRSERTEKID